jgi:hypothetical protein
MIERKQGGGAPGRGKVALCAILDCNSHAPASSVPWGCVSVCNLLLLEEKALKWGKSIPKLHSLWVLEYGQGYVKF